ncbi:MAG TPA: cytochrome D1 domain-containing protein [Anaerolineales bacterium]|nr:cytochrome D1 domain-containing protein [Anaerolineales bacterium]
MPIQFNRKLLPMLVIVLALAGCQTAKAPTSQEQPNTGIIAGRAVDDYYLDTCSGCHGADRRGATGPALLAERMSQDDSYYFDIIKNGKPGTVMPPWGGSLSDQEISDMVTYLRSDSDSASLQWSLEDTKASLEVLISEEELPTEPTHDANLDNLMLVTEREGRAIAVIDGDSHTLVGKIPASYRAHGYTFSPTEARWAYNMGRDGWVFKIDLYSLQPVRKIRIGLDSRSVAISDDGRYLIVANYVPATALILDADTLEPVKFIETKATNPEGEMIESRVATILDTAPDLVGPYFLVALKEAGQVWRIDWSQPDFPIEKLENVGHILHDGFLTPDNKTFYLAAQQDHWMAAIDVASMKIVEKIQTGEIPHPGTGAAWEIDGVSYGATVHAGEGQITIWDLDTQQIVASLETPGAGLFIRSHEDTPYIWADSVFAEIPHAIVVFEKEPPFTIVKIIDEGKRTLHPEFTSDGKFVYIADWDGDVVRVYDAITLEKVAEISGIHTPTGIFNSYRRYETLGH